jgi:hypothetical protein
MESVWLLLDGRRDAVRRPGLGFLGTAPFAYENPSFWGLVFLGFPWILSYESLVINGLREIFARNFFLRFVVANAPSKRRPDDPACEKDGLVIRQAYFNF